MQNFNYLIAGPAVPSRHRQQAEMAEHDRRLVRKCAEEGTLALYECNGGMYGYMVAADDINVEAHISGVRRLLLVGQPRKELTTVREVFEYLHWDYEEEKALFEEHGNDLDELKVGFVTVPETEEE